MYAGLDFDAWAEWDTSLWFEEGQPGLQVSALQVLLSRRALSATAPVQPAPLLAAIEASRKGQAELSSELGERVRQAVELLIQALGTRLDGLDKSVTTRDVYIAATRLVMRMVVVLFAEARDLLPRANEVYHASYGVQGLRELLDRSGGATGYERLRQRWGAWPRLLALFQLVHEGSHHEALPVPRYGGDLFAPGDGHSGDPVLRVLAALEAPSADHPPSDAVVQQVLELLCRCRVKVRQAKASTWVYAPVDFSDLSSEYIGILYEGLLDYELRRATEPMAFLALGDEPLLPLSRLEDMDDGNLKPLVEKLKVKKRAGPAEEEADEGDDKLAEDEEVEESDEEEEGVATEDDAPAVEASDAHQAARERAWTWARRAVAVAKLISKPQSKKAEAQQAYQETLERVARSLVKRVVLPGEWFLVRWGGTRKGAGTFYTRPQLAVPTVQRTLRPLAFDPPAGGDGQPDENAPAARWTPKRPEEVLALKVCDPTVGSGSFLIASLRFLTEALYLSLHHHERIKQQGETTLVTLAEGKPSEGRLAEELLPCRPDDDEFEPRLRARLKRYVVERCLYGVDIDPLAAELARLALWIETMDKDLPFEFLDHKVKVGNALVGCWFDRFRDYPALAWEREGGDKGHGNGVHFEKEAWTKRIKAVRNDRVKPELAAWIVGQKSLLDAIEGRTPEAVHDEALAVFEEINTLPVHEAEERARLYREKLQANPALLGLRWAFDAWCAVWFWPADELKDAPTPRTFEVPSDAVRAFVARLAAEHRFFHWELEFPDVFARPEGGFAALVGNPPWEIQKPNSKEHFSNIDPLYRTYGKQDALARQRELFESSVGEERHWLEYNARFKALSNWVKNVGEPFGDTHGEVPFLGKANAAVHDGWRARRAKRSGYSDIGHPFRHQGSADVNTYKLFLELSHALLRKGGQLGMLAPSGVYTDMGSTDLRTLFLNRCQWRWLFGFENREGIFDIHRSFKFGPLIAEKGGTTQVIRTAFMRRDLGDWENAETHAIPYARAQVERFSPKTRAILEIRAQRDLEVLEKIYANSVLLGDDGPDGWGITYAREFDMTNDSKLFPPRPVWKAKGYKPDEYGRWIGPDDDVALPLYEGRMIGQFDFSEKGWVSGKGRTAVWREIPWDAKVIEPQYLMRADDFVAGASAEKPTALRGLKTGFMAIASATNSRSMFSTPLSEVPCGNAVPVLKQAAMTGGELVLAAVLNSFTFDYALRARLGGINLNYFVIEETPVVLPVVSPLVQSVLGMSARLALPHTWFAPTWITLRVHRGLPWQRLWALTVAERWRIRSMLDALVAEAYGLDWADLVWILRDCDHPAGVSASHSSVRTLDPKGFWRPEKNSDPELRHAVLTLVAFHDLKTTIATLDGNRDRGIAAFCAQNDGDGWMLPETLRLADYGLGHDNRAQQPQPVRDRLGPRLLPWQLDQSVEQSWAECERHARNILGDNGFEKLQTEIAGAYTKPTGGHSFVADSTGSGKGQGNLF